MTDLTDRQIQILKAVGEEYMQKAEPGGSETWDRKKIWEKRHELGDVLRSATYELARRTGSIGVAVTDELKVYTSGYSHILDLPEFYDIDVTRTVLAMLDEAEKLMDIFRLAHDDRGIHILLGDDFNNKYMET